MPTNQPRSPADFLLFPFFLSLTLFLIPYFAAGMKRVLLYIYIYIFATLLNSHDGILKEQHFCFYFSLTLSLFLFLPPPKFNNSGAALKFHGPIPTVSIQRSAEKYIGFPTAALEENIRRIHINIRRSLDSAQDK